MSSQFLSLRRPSQAYWLKFVIDDVWAGNKYTDTAITKLLINSEHAADDSYPSRARRCPGAYWRV